jgi:magnesium chelatase family protein
MNPCPCGFFNHPEKNCSCVPVAVQRYLNKISGPLLDRIDLHVEVTPVAFTDLSQAASGETSATIRNRVVEARNKQAMRFTESPHVFANAQMPSKLLRTICELDATSASLLKTAMHRLNLSARAYDRILKVSRTIADLDGADQIQPAHVAEAIQYRSLDRQGWGG